MTSDSAFEYVFPAITLANGTNNIVYTCNADNDASTLDLTSSNDDAASTISIVPTTAVGSTFSAGFESDAHGDPSTANSTADNPLEIEAAVAGGVTLGDDVGNNSANSYRWRYFNIPAGQSSSLVLHKLDFSTTTNNGLSFYRSYAQYQAENDKLDVDVSLNCGTSWTNVYSKAGTNLTTDAATTSAFYPVTWAMDVVDLSAYDGESEVMIRFKGTSAYGNNLYIDDIEVNSTLLSVEDLNEETFTLSVYPNPTSDFAKISFNATENSSVVINITNTLGQTVYTNNLQNINGSQNFKINTTSFEAGLYLVNVSVNGVSNTKRITVVK